jgi:hypothetical protein
MHKPIMFNRKPLSIMKAIVKPNFDNKTILTDSCWQYVELWLKRKHEKDALFYWQQSQHFYNASLTLPLISSPLTSYYCFLNAAKAMLIVKKADFNDYHGVSGHQSKDTKVSLNNEIVTFKGAGILHSLSRHFNEPLFLEEFSLKNILYNLPYIHRSYNLTYTSEPELFIPIINPVFVKKEKSKEAWFQAELEPQHSSKHTLNKLPEKYERDESYKEGCIIRRVDRFNWSSGKDSKSITDLTSYHKKIRKQLLYIYSPNRLWYLKRNTATSMINRGAITLTFAAMHKLSELARYTPQVLEAHLESQHSWLISEFIKKSLLQFIDEISSEITGDDFRVTGFRN